jgi:hypothetical protein
MLYKFYSPTEERKIKRDFRKDSTNKNGNNHGKYIIKKKRFYNAKKE